MSDNPNKAPKLIYNQEPERRKPPIPQTGLVAWMRENLFKTWFDTIVTIISGLFILSVVTSLLQWSISYANWFAITRNFTNFMVGLLQVNDAAVVRVQIITLLVVFFVGFSIAAWSRASRTVMIITASIGVILLVVPALIDSTISLPSSYFLAGTADIVEGTQLETPLEEVAFVGRADNTVTVRIADQVTESDESIETLTGFADRATNALINNAISFQEDLARIPIVEAELEQDDLTEEQRAAFEAELTELQAATETTIFDRYNLNTVPVSVAILDRDLNVIAEATLESPDDVLETTLEADGWYVLTKTIDAEDTAILLETSGIYPVIQREVSTPLLDENGEVVLNDNGEPRTENIFQFLPIVSEYLEEDELPARGEDELPFVALIDNQYRGVRSLSDFLRLHVSPFFTVTSRGMIPILVFIALGYISALIIDRVRPVEENQRNTASIVAQWAWFAMPIVIFILLPVGEVARWGGFFLTMMLTTVGIVASFPLGIALALGRRSQNLPIISSACTLYIEFIRGVPLITMLFLASLALPLVSPALQGVPGVVRAMVAITLFSAAYLAENVRGGLQSLPPGQTEAAKALGLNSWQTVRHITMPQALRAVIPALVGQFISLFKDTSLVAIVGLLDITLVANNVAAQPEYLGLRRETYLFISIIYFMFSYAMSYISRRIEASGSGAARIQTT